MTETFLKVFLFVKTHVLPNQQDFLQNATSNKQPTFYLLSSFFFTILW
jgi:hypothetical protein